MIISFFYKKVCKKLAKFTLKFNKIKIFILITLVIFFYYKPQRIEINNREKIPTVLIVTLIRNKAHTLPYFLTYLENLDYPKSRLILLFQSDHNEDNSIEIINLWLNKTSKQYNDVKLQFQEFPKCYYNETSPNHWPKERFSHIIKVKDEALEIGQQLLVDFIFFIDADVFLTNRNSLKLITALKLPIISPMLLSEGFYSTFSCNSAKYKEIYERKKIGNFEVPIVHSAVLINLNLHNSKFLTFNRQRLNHELMKNNSIPLYDLPQGDITTFAASADSFGIKMFVSNSISYGYILEPLEKNDEIDRDYEHLLNIKLKIINDLGTGIEIKNEFKKYISYPKKNKLSLDHIYMINLERRWERREKMELMFKELSLDVEFFPAIDGKTLNLSIIEEMGIQFLPFYGKHLNHHPMKMGEVGCFLSHYKIWQKIVERGQREVLILEDDIRFEPYFREKAIQVLNEARKVGKWDLLYFGRKPLDFAHREDRVEDTNYLVQVRNSLCTLGYVITLNGAKKLIYIKPLKKLVPVDEFLAIMYNQYPFPEWNEEFKTRNLLAYSAQPLLVYPTCYDGDDDYISDTSNSEVIPMQFLKNYIKQVNKNDQ